jgi:hypothetical protein
VIFILEGFADVTPSFDIFRKQERRAWERKNSPGHAKGRGGFQVILPLSDESFQRISTSAGILTVVPDNIDVYTLGARLV